MPLVCLLSLSLACIASAAAAVPVVHAVGGLRDTVKPFNPFDNSGMGRWSIRMPVARISRPVRVLGRSTALLSAPQFFCFFGLLWRLAMQPGSQLLHRCCLVF